MAQADPLPIHHKVPAQSATQAVRVLHMDLGERGHDIRIGPGLLAQPFAVSQIDSASQVVVVSNDTVMPLYGASLLEAFRSRHPAARFSALSLPDGEQHKDWQNLDRIYAHLLAQQGDRKTLLIALGGGVVGDMVGFAAATYQRGISFVQVPTTLLAQVDSSVGGKTAINHALGKNMVGAFHQPREVVIDTDVLATLPAREFTAGLAEVIKYGIALDRGFFEWLETNMDKLLARDAEALSHAIHRSCEIKARVVADDEFETSKTGGRAMLNFGHTFGHAIESALGYGAWLHGEAVGCGMALATRFSARLGRISDADATRVQALISRAGLATALPGITTDTMLEHMARDKKNEHGSIRLILLDAIGQSSLDGKTPREDLRQFLGGED